MASTTALSRKDKQVLQDFDSSVRGMPHFSYHLFSPLPCIGGLKPGMVGCEFSVLFLFFS